MTEPSRADALRGVEFVKMTGSGNDFVFFDGRTAPSELLTSPDVIAAICNRHNGIGADGIVILEPVDRERPAADSGPVGADAGVPDALIRYFNSDGSPADLCGNATLCSTRLSVELGMTQPGAMGLLTPAGVIASRLGDSDPEIDLQSVTAVQLQSPAIALGPGEQRIGFATAGIPHLVVLCEDADAVDLERRGPALRRHDSLGPSGANVNWVSPRADGSWRYRTFERGVEGETLACGTGAIATAVLLTGWGLASGPVTIRTSSGRDLRVRFRAQPGARNQPDSQRSAVDGNGGLDQPEGAQSVRWFPSLMGEGRVVFRGRIATLIL